MTMLILDSIEAARVWRASVRQDHRVGLVPTMGALHAGHGRCITSCSATCDVTVVSIFVNRSQFGDPNDFDSYPRTWNEDLTLAQQAGADVVFAPREAEMAPLMAASPRHAGPLASLWEGRHRPGHFDAVVTVVNQLFSVVRPNRARFGEKDRQQLAVIRTWSTIEWPSIVIDAEPTVRETDGLAMSSRNVRLTRAARVEATTLHRALDAMQQRFALGERSTRTLVDVGRSTISPAFELDYLAVVDPTSFDEVDRARNGTVAIVAATIDGVRLIDNVSLVEPSKSAT